VKHTGSHPWTPTEQELKQFDKEAKAEVDAAVAEAKEGPQPLTVDLWTDIYYKNTQPPSMRGRKREEVRLRFIELGTFSQ
jgi:pyruvate dehydrogenase E1 component alpha subunit